MTIALALLSLTLTGAANAHHSTRVFYDYDADIEVEGRITWVLWRNPHVRFNIVSIDEVGREELWELEAGSMNTLERVGVGADTLKVGDVVRVAGPPSRRGLNSIYVSNVLFENGEEVSLQGNQRLRWTDESASSVPRVVDRAQPEAAPEVEGIFRVWTRGRGGQQETFPFTTAALAARETWDPLSEDPALRCIPPGMPSAMDNPYPIAFAKQANDIILSLEEWDGLRTIHMTADAGAENAPGTPLGYSVGRWEGNTLIVSTANIDYPYFDSEGTPQSRAVEIVERFTLSGDENRLDYRMVITDPDTFTAPGEFLQHYVWEPDEEIKPYECTLAD